MNPLTQLVISVASIVAASALAGILWELQALRRTIESKRLFNLEPDGLRVSPSGNVGISTTAAAGFAIFVFREGRWHLEADLSTPGCEATPPAIAGRFEGQVVRKESSPKV